MDETGKTKSQKIASQLQDMILKENQYKPNEKLPDERALAEQLGVSRTSVREAIKILVGNGVLTVRRGSGTFVASNPEFLFDPLRLGSFVDKLGLVEKWYQVRLMIEPEAMKLVLENITEEELIALKQTEERCRNLIEAGADWAAADIEFHTTLARATHNEILERFMAGVSESVSPGIIIGKSFARQNALEYHGLIVEYIEAGDFTGAYNAMRLHLLEGLRTAAETAQPV